jgi:GH25 family lysozyme M1 (1,4-beta-N-acetylmuramidase)
MAGMGRAKVRRRGVCLLVALGIGASLAPLAHAAPRGIDVSHYQGSIGWLSVAGAGYAFAFANASEGTGITDATYPFNRLGASGVGMHVGAYHFARPAGATDVAITSSAIAQADHFLSVAQPQRGDLLPVLDLEATGGLSSARLTAWTRAWMTEVVARIGVKPMIYVSPDFWKTSLADTPAFAAAGHRLWIAHWTKAARPLVPGGGWGGLGWTFWQWSDCTHVPGISGCVDGDRLNGANFTPATITKLPGGLPVPGVLPTIVGTPLIGHALAAIPGVWSGGKPVSFTYHWQRCDVDGADCAQIAGANRETYTPTAADAGHTLVISVNAQTAAGTATGGSAPSVPVPGTTTSPTAPRSITPPTITGTPQVGQTLTGSAGTWTGTPTAFAYKWRRCPGGGAACTAIPGATDPDYAITPGDIGIRLSFVVSASNRGGSRTAAAIATPVVIPAPVPAPVVGSAIAQLGQAGAVTTEDRAATATWQPGAVPDGATVTLLSAVSRLAIPGTAFALDVTGPSVLPWPVDVQFAAAPTTVIPGLLPGKGVYRPVVRLTAPSLPSGMDAGAYRDSAGALHVLTTRPGLLALFAPGAWGDPRFVPAGRPAMTLAGSLARARLKNGAVLLHGTLILNSQAHLYASVTGPSGRRALLSQRGSRLGSWLAGLPTKTLQVLRLRPAALPVRVRVAARQLRPKARYTLKVVAIDPYGRRAALQVRFSSKR